MSAKRSRLEPRKLEDAVLRVLERTGAEAEELLRELWEELPEQRDEIKAMLEADLDVEVDGLIRRLLARLSLDPGEVG